MRKKIMTLMMGALLLLTACGQTGSNSASTMLPVAAVQSAAQAIAPMEDKTQEDVDSLPAEEGVEEVKGADDKETPNPAEDTDTPSAKTEETSTTIFGGFAPNSQTAEQLSKSLGSRTVLSGSVSKGKNDPSQSLQMMERPLMTPDELKSIPKGSFVVMKTGTHPMQTKLQLFLDWGITFDATYATPEHAARPVAYASRQELFLSISKRYGKSSDQPAQAQQASTTQRRAPRSAMGLYSEDTRP